MPYREQGPLTAKNTFFHRLTRGSAQIAQEL